MSCLPPSRHFELPVPLGWGPRWPCEMEHRLHSKVLGKRLKCISDPGRIDQLIIARLPSSVLAGEISLSGAFCAKAFHLLYQTATAGTSRLPRAVPTINSTEPLFSQSQQICGALQRVQLAIRVIQPFHLQMTQKVVSACAQFSPPEAVIRSRRVW